jgi:hypothetical protein
MLDGDRTQGAAKCPDRCTNRADDCRALHDEVARQACCCISIHSLMVYRFTPTS